MSVKYKNIHLIIIIVLLYIITILILKEFIITDSILINTLKDNYTYDRILEIIDKQHKFAFIQYIATIVFQIIKILLVSMFIFIVLYFYNIDQLKYKNCCTIVCLTEIIPILNSFYFLIFFLINPPSNQLDFEKINNLSIFNFINKNNVSSFLIYPLQQINLFELAYWIVLTIGIKKLIQKPFWYCFKITALSYGIGLLIWVIFVVFLQIQFS